FYGQSWISPAAQLVHDQLTAACVTIRRCPLWANGGRVRCTQYVRFGSKADMCAAKLDVRFTPESDIKCDIVEGPLWPQSGHRIDYFRSASKAATCGKIPPISANLPGSVSTSIEPPCCLTTASLRAPVGARACPISLARP